MHSNELTHHAEMDFACLYSLRRPQLAREAATLALRAAIRMGRPDLTYRANALLAALVGGS